MIRMNKYDTSVETAFLNIVEQVVKSDDREKIVDSFRKYFPNRIILKTLNKSDAFRKLILADYNTLMKLYKGISKTDMQKEIYGVPKGFSVLYKKYHDCYEKVIAKKIGDEKLNVYLVRNSKTYTCPYCNRNYITVRGKKAAGAQLDHFISRKKYPVFALCLYNLVPCCNVCNLIKGKKDIFVSPFNPALDDSYMKFKKAGPNAEGDWIVDLEAVKPDIEKNIDVLRLRNAYEIHKDDLKELIDLKQAYTESQIYEICGLINEERITHGKPELSETDIRDMVFGKPLSYEDYGRKPLAKFRHDILKELGVYG